MPYNVLIKNDQGQPIGGTVYYYDATGTEIGQTVVPVSGIDLDASMVEGADHFKIVSSGYGFYGTSYIYADGNVFTLYKQHSIALPLFGGLVLGFLIGKMVRL